MFNPSEEEIVEIVRKEFEKQYVDGLEVQILVEKSLLPPMKLEHGVFNQIPTWYVQLNDRNSTKSLKFSLGDEKQICKRRIYATRYCKKSF